MPGTSISSLDNQDRPREKILKHGTKYLTDKELLAVILASGGKEHSSLDIAHEILDKFGDFKTIMNVPVEDILTIKNIGKARVCSIKAACEIALRIVAQPDKHTAQITEPQDVVNIIRADLLGKTKEMLYLLCLNSRNKLISKDLLSEGTVNETLIDAKEIFGTALRKHANAIILVHNHPSNDPTPSTEDITATKAIAETGVQMALPLLDHIVFCDHSFTSLKASHLFEQNKGGDKGD